MPPPDDKRSGRIGHPTARRTPRVTIAKGATSLPAAGDGSDPRAIGELLATWIGIRMAEVDDLVDEARSRVDAIPDQRILWAMLGEALVRLGAVELEVAQLRAEIGRLRQQGRRIA